MNEDRIAALEKEVAELKAFVVSLDGRTRHLIRFGPTHHEPTEQEKEDQRKTLAEIIARARPAQGMGMA